MKQTTKEDLYYEHFELKPSEKSINDYHVLLDDFIEFCIKNKIYEDTKIKEEYKKIFKTDCSILWWIRKEINKRIKNEKSK